MCDFLGLDIEKSQDLISLVWETEEEEVLFRYKPNNHVKLVLNLCTLVQIMIAGKGKREHSFRVLRLDYIETIRSQIS